MGAQQSVVEGVNYEDRSKFVHKIFEERLRKNSITNRTAIFYVDAVEGVRTTNFDNLNKNANRLAACILKMLRDDDTMRNQDGDYVIAVCMNRNDSAITTLLAIWKVGAAYLAFEPNLLTSQIQYRVNDAKPAMVICDQYADRSAFENVYSISYADLLAKSNLCSDDNIHTQNSVSCGEDGIAIILYTSGTDGLTKGVRVPHSAVRNKLQWLESTFPVSKSEKVGVLNSPISYVDSVVEIWNPLLNGVAVLIVPEKSTKDPSNLVHLLESYKVERLVLLPTLLTSILDHLSLRKGHRLSNLKTWMCGGETLTALLARKFFRYFVDGTHRLCNLYGTTETMGNVTYFVCENLEQLEGLSNVPIGYPIDNTFVYLMNDDLNPVKPGDIGEMFVAGSSLTKGYVADKEKSKFFSNRFVNNPKFHRFYRTGDFGKLIKQGCIQYEGRIDSRIKVRGNLVKLSDIETIVQSIDEVESGFVLSSHTGKEDENVLAFVVLKSHFGGPSSQKSSVIENALRTKFSDIDNLAVVVMESIPLLSNGKIDQQALLDVYKNKVEENTIDYDLTGIPNSRLNRAQEVFDIIRNAIGSPKRSTISAQSNFYDLGGDSLKSIIAVAQLRDKGYCIRPTDFVRTKCLADVLDKIFDEKNVHENSTEFKTIPLTMHHKYQVISIMTTTFDYKDDLGSYLLERSSDVDHKDFIEQTWEYLIEKDLSFAVTDRDGNIVGVSINKDGQDLPKIKIVNSWGVILEFLDSIEKAVLEKRLPNEKNKVFHNYVKATSAKLSTQENIEAIQKMEEVNLDIARRKGFMGILITNTNPLTQQLASDVYGYRTLVDYQINKYVHRNGSKPFQKAPDTQRAMVQWKNISDFDIVI